MKCRKNASHDTQEISLIELLSVEEIKTKTACWQQTRSRSTRRTRCEC